MLLEILIIILLVRCQDITANALGKPKISIYKLTIAFQQKIGIAKQLNQYYV